MKRWAIAALGLFLVFPLSAASQDVVRVGVKETLKTGRRQVVLSIYPSADAQTALATETRVVEVGPNAMITTPLGRLALVGGTDQDRWLGVRLLPGVEAARIKLSRGVSLPPTVHIVTDAAISANGIIESAAQGFRFPDGSIQTSAATVSGGVPSVNGIGSAVTITGAGTASVGTSGSTITITGSGLTGVTAGAGLTGGGSSGSPTLSANFGTPVSVGASNAAGVASTVARADHVHAHGNQAGGSLHSTATTGTAGFMSAADKTKLDGAASYARTIVVSPGADAIASGTNLLNALANITGNSSTNAYLVKIEPGLYNIGNSGLTMKDFVDVEGSGENATFIIATRGSAILNSSAGAIVFSSVNSELRGLSVANTSSSNLGIAVFSTGAGKVRLRNVTIDSTGAIASSIGVYLTTGAIADLANVTITATGNGGTTSTTGLFGSSSTTTTIQNSTITAKGVGGTGTNTGMRTESSGAVVTLDSSTVVATGSSSGNNGVVIGPGVATILNSTVRVDTATSRVALTTSGSSPTVNVYHSRLLCGQAAGSSILSVSEGGTSATVRIGASQVDGSSTGTPTCVHVYGLNFSDLNNVCPGPPA